MPETLRLVVFRFERLPLSCRFGVAALFTCAGCRAHITDSNFHCLPRFRVRIAAIYAQLPQHFFRSFLYCFCTGFVPGFGFSRCRHSAMLANKSPPRVPPIKEYPPQRVNTPFNYAISFMAFRTRCPLCRVAGFAIPLPLAPVKIVAGNFCRKTYLVYRYSFAGQNFFALPLPVGFSRVSSV